MEKPLNISQIRKSELIFMLVCLLTLSIIVSQVIISLNAKDSINYKVSSYVDINKVPIK